MPFPKTRAECVSGPRPCPWAQCRHHLDEFRVGHAQGRQRPLPVLQPWRETCVLDVVDRRGDLTLEEVGAICGLTRERIRQIEAAALGKLGKRYGGNVVRIGGSTRVG